MTNRPPNVLPPRAGATDVPIAPAKPRVQPPTKPKPSPMPPEPLWHVILLNDDLHSFEYVIEMLASVFGYDL